VGKEEAVTIKPTPEPDMPKLATPTEDVRYLQGIVAIYLKNKDYIPSQAEGEKIQAALERARANQDKISPALRAWLNRKDRAPLLDKLLEAAKTQKPVATK
jgi:hypothetical protein